MSVMGLLSEGVEGLWGAVRGLNAAKIGRGLMTGVTGSPSLGAALRDVRTGVPSLGLGASWLLGGAAYPLAKGYYRQVNAGSLTAEQLVRERKRMLAQKSFELEIQRMERDMSQNAARLAAVAPDLYNRVMAGRELPKGAVVLGGQPRTDLLEELAMRMANGEYQGTDPLDGLV